MKRTLLKLSVAGSNLSRAEERTRLTWVGIRLLCTQPAGMSDYGAKASADLIVTRGKGFTKEKNKKKRCVVSLFSLSLSLRALLLVALSKLWTGGSRSSVPVGRCLSGETDRTDTMTCRTTGDLTAVARSRWLPTRSSSTTIRRGWRCISSCLLCCHF